MAGLREVKRRMKAVKSTAQVTRAMQLVAASKMKRAQQHALVSRPYAQLLAQIFEAMPDELLTGHPLLQTRPIKRRGILIITPDKGLCGGLITNISREILKLPQDALYVAVGKKGGALLARQKREVLGEFHLSDKVRYAELRPAASLLLQAYEKGQVDTFEVLYAEFLSAVSQKPTLESLLPIENLQSVLAAFHKEYTAAAPIKDDKRPFILEPDAKEILGALIPHYIKQELYHTALEAKASEHSARMVAMKNATDNAKALGDELTLVYNKARQAAITQEILELASAGAASS